MFAYSSLHCNQLRARSRTWLHPLWFREQMTIQIQLLHLQGWRYFRVIFPMVVHVEARFPPVYLSYFAPSFLCRYISVLSFCLKVLGQRERVKLFTTPPPPPIAKEIMHVLDSSSL
jgi:hypothetical protein